MDIVPAALGLHSDQVRDLLLAAGRAPSLHNSQPWRFRIDADVIELWADPRRRLPAADPTGREQRLACGAALFNLRLAMLGHGVRPLVTVAPDVRRPDLLATVRHGGHKTPTPAQLLLLDAVARRRTNRRPFSDEPVTAAEAAALRRAAVEEGAWLDVLTEPDVRAQVRVLAARAHALQQADPRFRAEVARWTAVPADRVDGVPARADEHRPAAHERWVVRDFTGGAGRSTATTGVRFEAEPTIAVLSAHLFGGASEVVCGQALQRVLLTATVAGLAVSFLSHVIEVEPTRSQLRGLVSGLRAPQAVLRVGRGWPVPETPRRPVAELLDPGLAPQN